jgi:Glycosyl hydrolases family 25
MWGAKTRRAPRETATSRKNAIFGTPQAHGKPIIYTSPSFWREIAGDTHEFADAGYSLWIAHYTKPDDPPSLPGGWKNYSFWQYSDKGQIPGIRGGRRSRPRRRGCVPCRLPDPALAPGYPTHASAHVLALVRVATLRSSP